MSPKRISQSAIPPMKRVFAFHFYFLLLAFVASRDWFFINDQQTIFDARNRLPGDTLHCFFLLCKVELGP